MSAIIEPYAATWHIRDGAFLIEATCDGDVIIHTKSGGVIAIGMDELAEVEAALLNARLWLERATKQADELKAAEVAQDDDVIDVAVMCSCDHPDHVGHCDACGCDRQPTCYRCGHPLDEHDRGGCTRRSPLCNCPVANLTTGGVQ